MAVPVLFITGPVGVGKTTVAYEAGTLLAAAGVPHAVVDLDALAAAYPRPVDDGFNTRLAYRNLAAVWTNDAAAGAERLILAAVLEARTELQALREAIPGADVVVVRLRASPPTLIERVARREVGSGREWHLHRSVELADQMEREAVEDHLVDTTDRDPVAIARVLLERVGWLSHCAHDR